MIHLDTSFLIRAGVSGSPEDTRLRRWLRAREPVKLSAIAWAEFLCGPVADTVAEDVAELFGEPVAFAATSATLAAALFNAGGRRRGTLLDCMIAAIAIEARAALATSNVLDFRRFGAFGLTLAESLP